MPRISPVWRHFDKINKTLATCKICGETLQTAGNTSNMHQHLVNIHNVTLDGKPKSNLEPEKNDDSEDVSGLFKFYVTYFMYY